MPDNIFFRHPLAGRILAERFRSWRSFRDRENNAVRDLVFFCIGTANVPGDSLGPLVGEALAKQADRLGRKSIFATGTVSDPIHALNLADRYAIIKQEHPDALIVAVDAGLGLHEQVGSFAMWKGSLLPGIALEKDLPPVGDFGIAGIVGVNGPDGFSALQHAPGRMVRKMADRISHAICHM